MLKIKDDVDLKELEKYGFKKLDILDKNEEKGVIKGVYCLLSNDIDRKRIKNVVESYLVECFFNKDGYESVCNYPECLDYELIDDTNFDLIQAGLVEKVGK